MDATDTQNALTNARAQLAQLNEDIAALEDATIRNYSVDTQQTIQSARRHELADMYKSVGVLENRIATLCARLNGSGVTHGRAAC